MKFSDDDHKFMKRSLELAMLAKGRTSPNPMVGAVIAKDGKIIGEGYHQKAGSPHAEVNAIRNAVSEVANSVMYVNLEPCGHWGRTPPCTESIIESKINRVVISMIDPNPKVRGAGKSQLESHGIFVECGLLEAESKKLNEAYIKYIATGLPFVTIKAAMSLDGKIATARGESKWITSEACRKKAHELRNESDAILVGLRTIIQDDPSLTTRLPKGHQKKLGDQKEPEESFEKSKDPARVVVDSMARIPINSKVLNLIRPERLSGFSPLASMSPTIVAVTDKAPTEKVESIKSRGAEVIALPDRNGKVDLKSLMVELGKRNILSLLVEGGGEVNASILESGLVDKVIFFISTKLIGGKSAPTPIDGKGIQSLSQAVQLHDVKIENLGNEIVVEGYVHRNS